MKYAVVIEKAPQNYSAYVPDLPGCVATGDTLEEVTQKHTGGDRLPPGRHARGRNINTRTAGVNRPGRGV